MLMIAKVMALHSKRLSSSVPEDALLLPFDMLPDTIMYESSMGDPRLAMRPTCSANEARRTVGWRGELCQCEQLARAVPSFLDSAHRLLWQCASTA